MTSKQFFIRSLVFSTLIISLICIINWILDPFGLFHYQDRDLKPYSPSQERLCKYLYSFNYLQTNFEGLILGPSLSDNLNTEILLPYKIYNASINGGNISESKLIFTNILNNKGKIKYIVLCLDPYITKNSGTKTSDMQPSKYWGALGSPDIVKCYINELFVRKGFKKDYFNDYGYYNYNEEKAGLNVSEIIETDAQKTLTVDQLQIDPLALEDLKYIVDKAHQQGIKILAYYHPVPRPRYLKSIAYYHKYKLTVNSLFNSQDNIWDFNDEQYIGLTSDYRSFCDGTHLSYDGANYVLSEIKNKLDINIK